MGFTYSNRRGSPWSKTAPRANWYRRDHRAAYRSGTCRFCGASHTKRTGRYIGPFRAQALCGQTDRVKSALSWTNAATDCSLVADQVEAAVDVYAKPPVTLVLV